MTIRKPEFPLFPHKVWRPNPSFLNVNLPAGTIDPWAKRDDWRHSEFYSAKRRVARLLPGLGYGMLALGLYIAYDRWYVTQGPGRAEKEKWDAWMKERNERLAKEHGGNHH
ncbi:hypothetical protein BC833DRAFT_385870 [Globomyces pollinis-pini]|nr:hypothetical protein BC833DRAFT_385870 [Globomyces pollinis-pini]KAJ2998590.1 hypothetical protein HDV02_004405 [Globomyces sp. JEL0801]